MKVKNAFLGCGRELQSRFMETGHIGFACNKNDCKFEQAMGRCVYQFLKIVISLKNNGHVQVDLEEFGLDPETIDKFRAMFVLISNDKLLMKIHPAVSGEREGTTFTNVFQEYK